MHDGAVVRPWHLLGGKDDGKLPPPSAVPRRVLCLDTKRRAAVRGRHLRTAAGRHDWLKRPKVLPLLLLLAGWIKD